MFRFCSNVDAWIDLPNGTAVSAFLMNAESQHYRYNINIYHLYILFIYYFIILINQSMN